ncbi:uncharacterized protein DSM5745_01697 [Aspergillus mulundensis]|uniref:Uncharacterized protein n=1 Tax=Aspergillus mulundensis TaxID=1810919 RepID=A0A3D8SUD0_9EURO|nr:hypothetical protein DSM5745_01697 [Aspergillus mulundensis]RDW89922.1 hypothetical protein DSM5745_01697 [Aspergillus mulundensis]
MSEIEKEFPPPQEATVDISSGQMEERRMEIRFNIWSTLGLVYSTTATPIAVGSYLTFSLELGGSPFYIYTYIFAVTLNIVLCTALAEIAAVFPHPSGHIYWIGKLVPQHHVNVLSYCTGALTSAAWFLWTAGTYLLTAQILTAVAMALHPLYTAQPWHLLLISWAQALLAIAWNIPLFKTLPAALKSMVFLTNAGVLFIALALLVRTAPKQSAHDVFAAVLNNSGWPSDGVVFFLGLLPGTTAINGFDAAAHMVEEMSQPARQVPQVMFAVCACDDCGGDGCDDDGEPCGVVVCDASGAAVLALA